MQLWKILFIAFAVTGLGVHAESITFEEDKLIDPRETAKVPQDPAYVIPEATFQYHDTHEGPQISESDISDSMDESIASYLSPGVKPSSKKFQPPEYEVEATPIFIREGLPVVGGRRLPTDFTVDLEQFEEPEEYKLSIKNFDMVESVKPPSVEFTHINWWEANVNEAGRID